MSAYGIAGLVDGFFKGRQIKDGWQDRKDNKARQEKLDAFYADEQGRIAERHVWARDNQGRAVSDYDRARADEEALRAAREADMDAARSGEADTATVSTMGAVPPVPGPTTEAAASLPGAIDGVTRKSAAVDQFERYFDPSGMGAAPVAAAPPGPRRADVSPQDEANRQAAADRRDATAAPSPAAVAAQPAQAPAQGQQGGQIVPPMNMPDNPQMVTEGPFGGGGLVDLYNQGILPRRYVEDPLAKPKDPEAAKKAQREADIARLEDDAASVQPNYNHDWGSKGPGVDLREVANRGAAALGAVPQAFNNGVTDFGNALRGVVNPAVRYATGGEDGFEFPMQPYLGAAPAGATAGPAQQAPARQPGPPLATPTAATAPAMQPAAAPPQGAPLKSNVPASAPAVTKDLAAVADQALASGATPSLDAAQAAVAENVPLGASRDKPFTEGQRARAADSFVTEYLKTGSPRYVEELIRQGRFDEATKFQEFLDESTTKKGIKHWARAAFSATVGDFTTFSDEIIAGQNVAGYFGDTVRIVKDKSGFTDADGNITTDNAAIAGAKLILVDEKTGTQFEQVFNSPADLVTAGMYFASPEVQFENLNRQTEAARESALGAVKGQKEERQVLAKAIIDQSNKIIEASKGLDGVPTISQEEAEAQASAIIRRLYLGEQAPESDLLGEAPAGPPVLRRP